MQTIWNFSEVDLDTNEPFKDQRILRLLSSFVSVQRVSSLRIILGAGLSYFPTTTVVQLNVCILLFRCINYREATLNATEKHVDVIYVANCTQIAAGVIA